MNKQDAFFAGALFCAVCSIPANRLPGAMALGSVICALIAAVFLWRGLSLRASAYAAQEERLQVRFKTLQNALEALRQTADQELQCSFAMRTHMEDGLKQVSADADKILERLIQLHSDNQEVAAMGENLLREIAELLKQTAALGTDMADQLTRLSTDQRADLKQYFDHLKGVLAEQIQHQQKLLDRFDMDSGKRQEMLAQQHHEIKQYLSNMLDITLDFEKRMGALPDQLSNDSVAINDTLLSLKADVVRNLQKMESCIRLKEEQMEDIFTGMQEAMESQCRTLETEGKSQREWMDRIMQQYADITVQDMDALRSIMGDNQQ